MTNIDELRQYRILGITLLDSGLAFIGAFIVHLLLWLHPLDVQNKDERTVLQYVSSFLVIMIMFLGLGLVAHRIFGIKTALSSYLGLSGVPKGLQK